jgi:hypothetical protein
MLRVKQELRMEYREAHQQIKIFGLLRYDKAGMAS